MNKWQKIYCDEYYNGKIPRNKIGKEEFELLGNVKEKVIVHFPAFTGATGFIPERTETLIVTEKECNVPKGIISVSVLASNLRLWISRNQKIEYI